MTWESSFFDTISIELMRRQICEFRPEFTLCSSASMFLLWFKEFGGGRSWIFISPNNDW